MLRPYTVRANQSNRNVIGYIALGRPHQLIPTPRRSGTARMVAGQSTSALTEGRQGNGEGSRTKTNTAQIGSGEKKSINLLRGWPSASLLPAAALRAASQTALTDPKIWAPGLEYAPDPGYQPLREALARWLGRFYRDVIPAAPTAQEEDADGITITGGASQSLACLLQSFTDPGRTLAVWVVAPCYFLACPIFADAGFAGRMRAVPEDDEGVDMAVLEREMRALEETEGEDDDGARRFKDPAPHRKIYRHVIYCVPAFANPSGRTTTLARREALVDLARRHDALVVCDDVYDMLQWRALSSSSPSLKDTDFHTALLPRVVDLDLARGRSPHDPPGKWFGHAVSNGSFSKLVGPGTRTGWTYSTADFAFGNSQTGSTRSGGAASQLAAIIVCELLLLKGGEEECRLDTHIRRTLLPSYARRHAVLMRAVRAELVPLGVRVHEDSLRGHEGVYGGYFVWMTLPTSSTATSTGTATKTWPTAKAIADRCRADEALMIGNGELFAVHGDEEAVCFDNTVRLCFAWEDEDDMVDGVERLGRVIRKMLDEGPESWTTNSTGLGGMDQAK
ncbi:pyridoxal phosphate-dependent transferase [Xylaria telfairii]|nr:pyridoxal phosphate-dependent transferase [Xylaria telfairii]